MEAKFTPGPWRYMADLNTHIIRQSRDDGGFEDYVASTWGGEKEADARLIAAAPTLLEAVKGITSLSPDDSTTEWNAALKACAAAIAKATGAA